MYVYIYTYKYGIPFFGTNPYPTKQITEISSSSKVATGREYVGCQEGMSVYLGMEEKKKRGILCAGVIYCNLVCLFILNPDLLQVDVESCTQVREELEMIRTTLEGTKLAASSIIPTLHT